MMTTTENYENTQCDSGWGVEATIAPPLPSAPQRWRENEIWQNHNRSRIRRAVSERLRSYFNNRLSPITNRPVAVFDTITTCLQQENFPTVEVVPTMRRVIEQTTNEMRIDESNVVITCNAVATNLTPSEPSVDDELDWLAHHVEQAMQRLTVPGSYEVSARFSEEQRQISNSLRGSEFDTVSLGQEWIITMATKIDPYGQKCQIQTTTERPTAGAANWDPLLARWGLRPRLPAETEAQVRARVAAATPPGQPIPDPLAAWHSALTDECRRWRQPLPGAATGDREAGNPAGQILWEAVQQRLLDLFSGPEALDPLAAADPLTLPEWPLPLPPGAGTLPPAGLLGREEWAGALPDCQVLAAARQPPRPRGVAAAAIGPEEARN